MIAIFSFTNKAYECATLLSASLAESYHYDQKNERNTIAKVIRQAFTNQHMIIAICSPAIIIRILAPLLKDKRKEPPVIIVDEQAQYIIPLLGYHHGGRELSSQIQSLLPKKQAVIFHAGSCRSPVIFENPPDFIGVSHPYFSNEILATYAQNKELYYYNLLPDYTHISLPKNMVQTDNEEQASLRISFNEHPQQLGLHPKLIHIGIGLERYASIDDLYSILSNLLADYHISWWSVATINSIDLKIDEPALWHLQKQLEAYAISLKFHDKDCLKSINVPNPSAYVEKHIGVASVAEASALLQAGEQAILLAPKQKYDQCTVAIAQAVDTVDKTHLKGYCPAVLHVVGIGPGASEYRSSGGVDAITQSDIIIGYDVYVDLIKDIISHQKILTYPLGQETQRAQIALEYASQGYKICLLASGDAGIYALAMLVLELAHKSDNRLWNAVPIITHPAISAFQLLSAKLGAPAGNDCCLINLSNIMTPEKVIIQRLQGAVQAEFVTFLYNPRSHKRHKMLDQALSIFRQYYHENKHNIIVTIGKNLGRAEEKILITNLQDINTSDVDMFSTIMIGNLQTTLYQNPHQTYIYAPRGYLKKGG